MSSTLAHAPRPGLTDRTPWMRSHCSGDIAPSQFQPQHIQSEEDISDQSGRASKPHCADWHYWMFDHPVVQYGDWGGFAHPWSSWSNRSSLDGSIGSLGRDDLVRPHRCSRVHRKILLYWPRLFGSEPQHLVCPRGMIRQCGPRPTSAASADIHPTRAQVRVRLVRQDSRGRLEANKRAIPAALTHCRSRTRHCACIGPQILKCAPLIEHHSNAGGESTHRDSCQVHKATRRRAKSGPRRCAPVLTLPPPKRLTLAGAH